MYLSKTIISIGDKFLNPISLTNVSALDQPLVYVNKAFRDMTKYENDFLIGRNCRFLQGVDSDKAAIARVRQAIKENAPICQDLINYTGQDQKFYNRLVLLPFKEGEIQYYIGLQNIIEERQFKSRHSVDRMFLEDKLMNPLSIIVGQHMMALPEMEENLKKTFIRIKEFVNSL